MSAPAHLKPFWRYYGGKWRAAPRYPKPTHDLIVEPFAGAAGYSLRHYQHDVWLCERYPIVAEMWRYLIGVSSAEILAIPYVEHVDELPSWVPAGGRALVGFTMNAATTAPCKALSSGRKKQRAAGRVFEGWSEQMRARVADQVQYIRHWRVFEDSCTDDFLFTVGNPLATWFVDPPYVGRAGSYYVHGSESIDYARLGEWCRTRRGQVIVCENTGASWLPFEHFANIKASNMTRSSLREGQNMSAEAIWLGGAAA